MASIQKTAKGYRAHVYVKGVRETRSFATRREAVNWAEARSNELRTSAALSPGESHTVGDALRKYAEESSPQKRGSRWELIRLASLQRDVIFPHTTPMCNLTPDLLAKWRDARLQQVSAGTVLREISLISAVLEKARAEWRWIQHNPMREIKKPREPDHRDTLIQPWQSKRLLRAMGYSPTKPIRTVAQSVAVCFLVAMRTGMRAGELTGLSWDRVFPDHCFLPVTKTRKRSVPLTTKAIRLLDKMRDYDPGSVFGLSPSSLDANFRKYRDRARLSGFRFHDARHSAATMMAKKVDVLTLCKIMGWTNPKMAMVYVNPTISDIAVELNRRVSR